MRPFGSGSLTRHVIAWVCAALCAASLTPVSASAAVTSPADPLFPFADTRVRALARSGDTLYVGGEFQWLWNPTGGLAAFDATSAALDRSWPIIDGTVDVIVGDGDGGFYVAGDFAHVGAVPRARLAHLDASGTPDGWDPGADGEVLSLVPDGARIFIAGRFTTAGHATRPHLAAIDRISGTATNWNPAPDNTVRALAVSGSRLLVGGDFQSISALPHPFFAAIDRTTGALSSWGVSAGGSVRALAVDGTRVFVGGSFAVFGGYSRAGLAALDSTTGVPTSWAPAADDTVMALAVSGTQVYAGGAFRTISGQPVAYLAVLDRVDASPVMGRPAFDDAVTCLALSSDALWAGGRFSHVGASMRRGAAVVLRSDGSALPWAAHARGEVRALALDGPRVRVGTASDAFGWPRTGIGAVDLVSGMVLPWAPSLRGAVVEAILADAGKVHVGGSFTFPESSLPQFLATFDATTGARLDWGDRPTDVVLAMQRTGDVVYITGWFDSIGVARRSVVAALDRSTGALLPWDLHLNPLHEGYAVAADSSALYLAGTFFRAGPPSASNLAATSLSSAAPVAFPAMDLRGAALLRLDDKLFVGGAFQNIGGLPRSQLAAVDVASSTVTAWRPDPDGLVLALAADGAWVYAGGLFTHVSGRPRQNLAAFDRVSGTLTTFDPAADDVVWALAADPRSVLVGGNFQQVGGLARRGLARIPTGGTGATSAHVSAPSGDTLYIDSPARITWYAGDPSGIASVDLLVSRTGPSGPWSTIASGLPNSGAYDWTVHGPAASTDCFVRVDAHPVTGGTVSGVSALPFAILPFPLGVEPVRAPAFALAAPWPNPAAGSSRVAFRLSRAGRVRLTLLDIQGRTRHVLVDGELAAGPHEQTMVTAGLPAGLYFMRLQSDEGLRTARVVVLR